MYCINGFSDMVALILETEQWWVVFFSKMFLFVHTVSILLRPSKFIVRTISFSCFEQYRHSVFTSEPLYPCPVGRPVPSCGWVDEADHSAPRWTDGCATGCGSGTWTLTIFIYITRAELLPAFPPFLNPESSLGGGFDPEPHGEGWPS